MVQQLRSRHVVTLAVVSMLAGCGGGGWFGSDDAAPLPGTRVPVLMLDESIRPDPALAGRAVTLPPAVTNAAWPQSGGSAENAMHHLATDGELSRAWRANVGSGSGSARALLGTPVVADGRVFAADAAAAVSAFDAANGRRLWRFEPRETRGSRQLGAALAHDRGRLFVATGQGNVIALDAETGAELWREPLRVPLRAAPTVAGGRVLALSADNQLFALDAATGEVLWRHAGIFEPATFFGGPSPAVAGDLAIVPYSSGEVFALRLEDGAPLWSDIVQRPRRTMAMAAINDINGHPVVDRDRLYVVGHGGEMAALDVARGLRHWEIEITSTETPWVAGDHLFVLTSRGEVVALLRDGGRVRWVSALQRFRNADDPGSPPIHWSGPVLAGERLLVVGSHGRMLQLSPHDGEVLGSVDLGGTVRQAPVVAGGTVYVLTEGAELLAYR